MRIPAGTKVTLLPTSKLWKEGERFGWVTDHRGDKIWVRLKSGNVRRVSRDEFELESSFRTRVS